MTTHQDEQEEASSPSTPPPRLQELAGHTSREVRRSVAKNASTPFPAVIHLCREFPEEFLENPSLPLWRLSDPGFFERLPEPAGVALARCPGITLEILWHLAASPLGGVRYAVATSSLATEELLELLKIPPNPQAYVDFRLLQALAQHPNTPPRLLEELSQHAYLKRSISQHPKTPDYLRRVMCESIGTSVPETPPAQNLPRMLQRKMLQKGGKSHLSLAEGATPEPLLRRLASSEAAEVRLAIAANPNASLSTRIALSNDKNRNVRNLTRTLLAAPSPRP